MSLMPKSNNEGESMSFYVLFLFFKKKNTHTFVDMLKKNIFNYVIYEIIYIILAIVLLIIY